MFEQFSLGNPYFAKKIKTWCIELSEGPNESMYKSQRKLKGLKESVKKWNKENFDNIFADKKILETRWQEI